MDKENLRNFIRALNNNEHQKAEFALQDAIKEKQEDRNNHIERRHSDVER